ncbi:gamma-tubulin complex component 2-like isoform X1 [Dreissena polymorpha]|uniref:gamma-tubulin complex component 2-like isoform X1 n=2 Tax=Dreissena polymorpha TaxID=45954 RepID=UPI002264FA14|nr:gamma-tubulin complex component 2-like isoform X1 [Dreissena polymorpha]XP_052239669.1 gamma-tubulin complex component 2-like isoform X1 [Dreissena polymorpha]XP_052239670.1 gamma-tubulin complex component 2-like isoform X1 [Dreissena polymorpha]
MSEFKVHHHVSELMNQLSVRSTDTVGAEVYTEMLLKNTTPYITTNVSANQAKRKIAESTKTPIEFMAKYDDLKSKNVRDLDTLVFFLSKLEDEHQVKEVLETIFKEHAEAVGATTAPHDIPAQLLAPGSKYTPQNLLEIQMQLKKLKEGPAFSQVTTSEILRKALRERPIQRNVNVPHQPDWLFQRPALTMDFIVGVDGPTDSNIVPLGSLPTMMQEHAILDDLLCCLQGIEGKYILARALTERYAPKEFMIDQSLDASLQEMVKRILPLASNYSTVVRFIEEKSAFEYGLVNHALSSAMRTLIKDYMVLVAQLEQQLRHGSLSLQKLWFYIQPSIKTLDIMASVSNSINRGECIGGAVLSLLHEKTSSFIGDVKGQELCLYLTQSACVPYLEILEKWIYKGTITDPYSEFLVVENVTIQKEKLQEEYNDDYWEHHYTICRERIPVFLEQMADKILNTGKYLNVVRQCGRDVQCPSAEEIVYTLKEKKYYEHIERAYSYASKLLLDLLMEEKELLARIRSIKHYFLLDKGDFIVQFMDMTEDEMKQDLENIHCVRLESLLELALRTSTANVDPYKDDLKVDLLQYDLITQMFTILSIETNLEGDYKRYRSDPTDLHLSGLESFTFDYVVKWPVSLVLNRKALTRYQMLFRHLFYTKHVERQLCSVWVGNKTAKMYSIQSARWYSAAFALRQRMLNFVQNFEYYMMFEVVEPSWHVFQTNMNTVSNVDDVLGFHSDFLNNCLKDCMLTNPQLLKIVHKLMMVCVTFSNFIQRLGHTTEVQMDALVGDKHPRDFADKGKSSEKHKQKAKVLSEHVDDLVRNENFERTIANFDANFSRLLLELLDRIMEFSQSNDGVKLLNILYRLDFNGFYTERLEALSAERAAALNTSTHSSESGSTSSWPTTTFTTTRPENVRYVPGKHYSRQGPPSSTGSVG